MLLADPRVTHRWDERQLVGRAYFAAMSRLAARRVPESNKPTGPVLWDAYLLYPAGTRWETELPMPSAWGYTIMQTRESLRNAAERLLARAPQRD
jgi:hypothetical protein